MVRRQFLMCIDDSAYSLNAFRWAAKYIFTVGDVVIFFHVFKSNEGVYYWNPTFEITKPNERAKGQLLMERYTNMAKEYHLDPRAILSGGDPRDRIIKAAEDLNVDGVIIGHRGMSFLKRTWMGSVSNYIVKSCKCPVIVVKNNPEFFQRKSITDNVNPS